MSQQQLIFNVTLECLIFYTEFYIYIYINVKLLTCEWEISLFRTSLFSSNQNDLFYDFSPFG